MTFGTKSSSSADSCWLWITNWLARMAFTILLFFRLPRIDPIPDANRRPQVLGRIFPMNIANRINNDSKDIRFEGFVLFS